MSVRAIVLFVLGSALATGAASAAGTDALAPYRELARSAGAPRILALTRAEIARAFGAAADSAAVADSSALDWPGAPCGVYLSLAHGATTRACVGSLTPLAATLGRTLRELSRQVVASDPRHAPLRREELDSLRIVIAFAGTPAPVADPMQIAPAHEALLIASPMGSVAFLPGEARTVSWALREARRIGVLTNASDASYQRFAVVTVQEPAPAAATTP